MKAKSPEKTKKNSKTVKKVKPAEKKAKVSKKTEKVTKKAPSKKAVPAKTTVKTTAKKTVKKPEKKTAQKTAQKKVKAAAKKPVKKGKPVKTARTGQIKKNKKTTKKPAKSGKKSIKNLKYSLHQKIVYPLHGVGQIESIEERVFQEKKILYYVIYLDVPDMTVMMPVDEAEDRGIRAIVSKKEAQKALNVIAKDVQPISADWKMRYQMNLDLLKKGSVLDIAKVVRSLYNRSKIKELPILERKLFDSALKLLIDEIAYSLDKEKDQVETLIFKKMETE